MTLLVRAIVVACLPGVAIAWTNPGAFAQEKIVAKDRYLLQTGFSSTKSTVVFSPDGRYFAAAGHDKGMVIVWECSSGMEKSRAVYDGCNVSRIQFSRDGKHLAIALPENSPNKPGKTSTKIIDVNNGREDPKIKVGPQLTFYAEKKEIAIIAAPFVKVIDKDERVVREFQYRPREGDHLVLMSVDQKMLAVNIIAEKAVQLWNVDTSEKNAKPLNHESSIRRMLFSSSCKRLVTQTDKHVQVWNIKDGELVHKIPFKVPPGSIALDNQEKWLAVGFAASTEDVNIIDMETGKLALTLKREVGPIPVT